MQQVIILHFAISAFLFAAHNPSFYRCPFNFGEDLSMAGNVQEKQLRWYNIALCLLSLSGVLATLLITMPTRGGGCFFMGVYLCALFHTLCAIVGQLGSTFKDGKGGVSTWINTRWDPDWLTSPRGPTGWCISLSGTKTPGNTDCARLGDESDGSLIKEYSVVALQGLTLVCLSSLCGLLHAV